MASREKTFCRLVGALDELVSLEAMTLKTQDYDGIEDVQRRVDPIISTLATLQPELADDLTRARVAGILARRQHNIDFIESQLATARAELALVQESTGRVAKIAPVYGRADNVGTSSRFRAAG